MGTPIETLLASKQFATEQPQQTASTFTALIPSKNACKSSPKTSRNTRRRFRSALSLKFMRRYHPIATLLSLVLLTTWGLLAFAALVWFVISTLVAFAKHVMTS